MIKIFHGYLIKRSFLISLSIFILFAILDLVFSLMSELENLSEEYNFSNIFLYVLSVSPSNAINFLEGACLLGVMISLGISHQEGNINVLRSSGESPLKIVLISSIGPILLIFLFLPSNQTQNYRFKTHPPCLQHLDWSLLHPVLWYSLECSRFLLFFIRIV